MSQVGSTVWSVGPSSQPGSSFTRRLRVLAHLQPLLDIEHDKNRAARAGGSERNWDVYDMRLLQLAAFDAICKRRSKAGARAGRKREHLGKLAVGAGGGLG